MRLPFIRNREREGDNQTRSFLLAALPPVLSDDPPSEHLANTALVTPPTPSPPTDKKTLGILVNSLPNEVISEIFYRCTPYNSDADAQQTDPEVSPYAALALSHVCKHWRTVALASPRIWTYVKITIRNQNLSSPIELMRLYMERAKTCSVFLDFDFADDFTYYKHVMGAFERIVEVAKEMRGPKMTENAFLATHLEASSTEHLARREEWYFWEARRKPTTKVSLLEDAPSPSSRGLSENSITEYLTLANTPASDAVTEETFSSAPTVTLRALRVAAGSFVVEPYRDWSSSLTFLVLKDLNNYTNLTNVSALEILSAFPLLIHCSMHIDFEVAEQLVGEEAQIEGPAGQVGNNAIVPRHRANQNHHRIQLQFLKSFCLSWSDFVNTGQLLDALYVPALRELELDGMAPDVPPDTNDGGTDGTWPHLVRFLRRNRPCKLTHLILTQLDLFHIDFLSALPLIPQLEGLWLEDVLLDDNIMRGMQGSLMGRDSQVQSIVMVDGYALDIGALVRLMHEVREMKGFIDEGAYETDERCKPLKLYVDKCGEVTAEHLDLIHQLNLEDWIEIGPGSLTALEESSTGYDEEGAAVEVE